MNIQFLNDLDNSNYSLYLLILMKIVNKIEMYIILMFIVFFYSKNLLLLYSVVGVVSCGGEKIQILIDSIISYIVLMVENLLLNINYYNSIDFNAFFILILIKIIDKNLYLNIQLLNSVYFLIIINLNIVKFDKNILKLV